MDKYEKWILTLCLILIISLIGVAQNTYTEIYEKNYKNKLEEYEKNLKSLMVIDKSPGISAAFVKGSFIWSKGFGKIDAENEVEINSESLFNNKTLIRLMIAASVLQLYEDEKINLENSLQSYLPNTKISQKSKTLKEILKLLGPTIFTSFDRVDGFKLKSNFQLSQKEIDEIYTDLISLIKITSQQKFNNYLKVKIWNPLLMFNTKFENKRSIMQNRVKSYFINRGEVNNYIEDQITGNIESLQIRTTVNDMIKFAYGFISNKLFKNIKYEDFFLSEEDNKENPINLSWPYKSVNGRFGIGFLNDANDDNSILVVFPKDTFAVAIASNLKNANLFPYLKRLYHLVLEEQYGHNPYFKDLVNKLEFKLLNDVFNSGLSTYQIYGKAYLEKEINFKILNSSFMEIENNNNLQLGLELKDIGCFIASNLSNEYGSENLRKYHQRGAIEFFRDYIKLYNAKNDWPSHLKLNSAIENKIENWAKEWDLTLNDFTSEFYIDPGKNNYLNLEKLKELYTDKILVPNFSYEFSLAIDQLSKLNKMKEAHGVGALGIELFKTSPDIYHSLGISFAWFKDADITYDLFRMAQEFTPADYSRVDHFIEIAEEFNTWGKIKEAISMIDRATKLDKGQPRLFSCIGDLYLEIYQITRAKRYYNKAIKIDPDCEYAKEKIKLLNEKYKK